MRHIDESLGYEMADLPLALPDSVHCQQGGAKCLFALLFEQARPNNHVYVDDAVKRGKGGEPVFYACENGRASGTATPSGNSAWQVNDLIYDRHYCDGCEGECVGQEICYRTG